MFKSIFGGDTTFQSLPGNSKMVSQINLWGSDFNKSLFQSLPGNSKMVSDIGLSIKELKAFSVSIPSREFQNGKIGKISKITPNNQEFQSLPGNSKMVREIEKGATVEDQFVSIPSREF